MVGQHGIKPPVGCKRLLGRSVRKMDEAINRDETLHGSAEGGIEARPVVQSFHTRGTFLLFLPTYSEFFPGTRLYLMLRSFGGP